METRCPKNVIRIQLIPGRERAIGDDVQENVDHVVAPPTAIANLGCRSARR